MEQVLKADYSVSDIKLLPRQFQRTLKTIGPVLEEKFGKEGTAHFQKDCLKYYEERIIPSVPYIGGNSNPFTSYLIQATTAIAVYQVIKEWGMGLTEAGEIIYRGMMLVVGRVPKLYLRLYGLRMNSSLRYPRWRRDAQVSQQKKFPGDWVFSFVEGDGQEFDYGIDMHECGIMKYLQKEGVSELGPYLCAVDYITHAAMGIELRRTQAIAFGCQKCDFRFIVHGKPQKPVWPPQFPEKNCGK